MNAELQYNNDLHRDPPRAVFSTDDFRLLREAVASHMRQADVRQSPDGTRFSALYHRLGRVI